MFNVALINIWPVQHWLCETVQNKFRTRMHSSRMRTGRTLTVFQCLVPVGGRGVYPQRKQKSKKIPPPKKSTPLKNWRPPEKLETPSEKLEPPPGLTCKACWDTPPTQDWPVRYAQIPSLWTDTRLWKYYLGQNFVSAGNNLSLSYNGRKHPGIGWNSVFPLRNSYADWSPDSYSDNMQKGSTGTNSNGHCDAELLWKLLKKTPHKYRYECQIRYSTHLHQNRNRNRNRKRNRNRNRNRFSWNTPERMKDIPHAARSWIQVAAIRTWSYQWEIAIYIYLLPPYWHPQDKVEYAGHIIHLKPLSALVNVS